MKLLSPIAKLMSYLKGLFQTSDTFIEPPHLPCNLTYRLLVGPQTFYVLFRDSDHPYFGKWFLKKGFSHCMLVQRHEFGWIMLNPNRAHLHIDILDFWPNENPIAMLMEQHPDIRVVECIVNIDIDVDQFFTPITCVSQTNYMLGLNWQPFTCMTPYALYKNLLKKGHPNIIKVCELKHVEQSKQTNEASSTTSEPSGAATQDGECSANSEECQGARESAA